MREKKMGMRRLAACVLAAALALGGAATTLATPTVAEAYPQGATFPIRSKDDLSYYEKDKPVVLKAGEDYVLTGKVDIDYYEVQGGTAENPTRLYFSNDSYLGGPLTDMRNKTYYRLPLFVVTGGYVEFIGDSGAATKVVCNGKTFLGDSDNWSQYLADKPNTGKKLNLTVKDLTLVANLDRDCDRAIMLYGTMGKGETVAFTNVNVSNWNCAKNAWNYYSNDKNTYTASPAPVTVRGSQVAVDATFTNCTFSNNADDCVGALSVVGRNAKPHVTLDGCKFENNTQSMIACDYLKVEDNHVHSGNIVVRNADLSVKNCSIRSTPDTGSTSWDGPCEYMIKDYKMHMTSGIAVAKDASCTIESSTIDDLYASPSYNNYGQKLDIQDSQRCAIYALGSVTLAGNTKVTTAKAKGVDASDVSSNGKIHVDKSFTGEAVLSVDDAKFDPESNKQYYYYDYVDLGTSDLSQEDLASRLKFANADLAYDVTGGKVKVIHRKHEHEWTYSANKDGYSIAATCNGQYEASHCVYSRDGETISLMSSKSGDLSFTYNGKPRDAVLDTTKPSQKDNAVAQGKVKIVGARFYRCVDENDIKGIEMEGSQPCDAGTYRVVATVAIEDQNYVTLERVFKIDGIKLNTCKVEVLNNDTVKNNLPAFKWTGEKITPQFKVTATVDGETVDLRLGADYEFDQDRGDRDGTDPGTYRTWLWGLGNFAYGQSFYWSIYGTQFENVQAKGFDGTYDGKAHSPSVTVDNAPEGMQIEYSVDGGTFYEDRIPSYTNVTRDIYGNVCAETIKYRITAPDYVPVEGELEIKITPADQAAPKDVKTTAATGHALADGCIDGIDSTYEWKAEAASDYQWIAEGETSVKGLAAGKYSVRRKADSNHNASEALTVEVKDGPKKADGTGWKHDDTEHWNTCTCGKEDVDRAKHDFEWVVDQAATADKPGSKHERCKTCGYERESVEIPAFGITGYSGIYDGEKHGVTVDTNTVASIQYREKGEKKWSDESPLICDAGSKTVEFNATLTSGDTCEGEVELKVDPRAITVTADDSSKTYGDFDPALGWEVTEGKLVEGESLEGITVSRKAGETVRKGGYAVTATQSEGTNPNYEITFKDGKFAIDKRELTLEWDATTEFTYDGEKHCPTATLGNVMGDDDVSAYVDGAAVKAGAYTAEITELTGADKANYKLPATGLTCKFSIKKAPKGAPVVQGVAETVSARADGKITGVDAAMEWRTKDSGEYRAVPEGATELSGLAAGTYEVRYRADDDHETSAATKVTVATGRELAVALPAEQIGYKLTADATELDWHGSATLTISIEDGYFADPSAYVVKVNDSVVTLNERGEFTVQDVEGDVRVTVEGVRKHETVSDKWISDDNTHWHECTCGGKIDEAAHTFTWVVDTPPTATEKGFGHRQCVVCGYALASEEIPAAAISGYSGEYDGANHTVNTSALPEGATAEYSTDDGKTWSATAPEIKDAGALDVAYKVMIGGATVEGQVTLEVTPRAITVTAQDASKIYGEKDPVFEWSITSGELVGDDTLELEIEREDCDDVREGGYALRLTQPEGANPNYAITFIDGTFIINQRLLTVTWGTTEFVYDGKEHCPVAELGNVIGKDDLGAFVDGSQTEVGTYTATLAELTGKAAGNYTLPADGLTCEFSIKNAAQDAPVVQAEAETVSGKKDGKITGVDATMEWRARGAAEYQAVGKDVTELKDLAAGVYEVRYQAKANYDASAVTEVTVKAGRKLVVTLPGNQVGYTLTSTATELDWHGSAKLAISIDGAYFTGKNYAVNVNGKAVKLADDGTYELKDVEGDVNVTVEGVLKHEPDGSGWAHDAKNHWHICRCGEVLDKAEHTFEWVVDKPATTEAKGERHQECTACGEKGATEGIAILAPTIIEGAGQAITVDTAKDLSFRSNAPIKYFQKVLVDDKEVDAENYVLTEGSTIVTLKTSFVKTLGVGEHKLSVVSTTGTAETTFTIAEAAKPAPGQTTTTTTTTSSKSKKKTGKGALPSVGDGTYTMAGGVLAAGMAALLLAWTMKRRA